MCTHKIYAVIFTVMALSIDAAYAQQPGLRTDGRPGTETYMEQMLREKKNTPQSPKVYRSSSSNEPDAAPAVPSTPTGKLASLTKMSDYSGGSSMGWAVFTEGYVFINPKGQIITPPFYNQVQDLSGNFIVSVKKDKEDIYSPKLYGLVSADGKVLLSAIYDEILPTDKSNFKTYIVSKDGNFGIADLTGKFLVSPIYSGIDAFGDLLLTSGAHKYGLMDKTGKILAPLKFDKILRRDDVLIVSANQKYGIIGNDGKIIRPLIYSFLDADNGFFKISMGAKMGIADKDFKEVIPMQYDEIAWLSPTSFKVYNKQDKHWGIIDKSGKTILPSTYDDIKPFNDKYFEIYKNGKQGLADQTGKQVVPAKFDGVNVLGEEYFITKIRKDNYQIISGIFDKEGHEIIVPKYTDISVINDRFFLVNDQYNQYGLVTRSGKEVVAPRYPLLKNLTVSDTAGMDKDVLYLFVISEYSQYGLIDGSGNVIVAPTHHYISFFDKDLMLLEDGYPDDRYGLADKTGKIIAPVIYSSINKTTVQGYYEVKIKNAKNHTLVGIINDSGDVVLEPKYEDRTKMLAAARKKGIALE